MVNGPRHAKQSLKALFLLVLHRLPEFDSADFIDYTLKVGVIPKEGLACVAVPMPSFL